MYKIPHSLSFWNEINFDNVHFSVYLANMNAMKFLHLNGFKFFQGSAATELRLDDKFYYGFPVVRLRM